MSTGILRVPTENFAFEILSDLPNLLKESPTGITIHQLHEYYGDSTTRIWRAISHLEHRHLIKVYQGPNGKMFILPPDQIPLPFNMGSLSDLQRNTVMFILNLCNQYKTAQVKTNYSQLARVLNCSATGIRTCVARLVELRYLAIVHPSAHGKQSDLILALGPALEQPTEISASDHHLTS